LGRELPFDPLVTVEGKATETAVMSLAQKHGLDLPVTMMVDTLASGSATLEDAMSALMNRPLKQE